MNSESVWRYLASGHVVHLLPDADHDIAACGARPRRWWIGEGWFGTGSQNEYETAGSLARCRKCVRREPAMTVDGAA